MKRSLALFLAVMMMVTLLAGCGTGTTPQSSTAGSTASSDASSTPVASGEVEEVYFFSSIGAYQKLLEQEVLNWNETVGAEKGIRIVMETNIDNYAVAAETMMEAGTFPDLVDAYAKPNWLNAGWVRDLYTVPGIEDLIERFEPYLAQGTNLRGDVLVALPLELVPLKMVYNVELFKEAGLDGAPKTWDEMVEYARIITEKGNGDYYGFGWTTMWTASFRRLGMKATMSSTGQFYFDSNTGAYDFTPYRPLIDALTTMYQEGSMFPSPLDQHIDPIRNRFAEGIVGMEIAPAYDISVYNNQFPCDFEWAVADVPTFTAEGMLYKGVSLNRANISITSAVTEDRLPAVVEVFRFLHSEELYQKLYANCAIIPHEAHLMDIALEVELKNWSEMSDITNYTFEPVRPDSLLNLNGDDFHVVFTNIMLGETTWDKEIESLNQRYNDAYQAGKADGTIDPLIYEQPYSNALD